MKIEKIIEEIRKETEEEINKILLSAQKEIEIIEKDTEEKLKKIEEKWEKIRKRELSALKEKNEGEIQKEVEALILKRKNGILKDFKEHVKEELKKVDKNTLKEFFLKEIERSSETGKEKIVIEKDFNSLFDEEFKREIRETIEKKLGQENLKFEIGNETEVVGDGFVVTISPLRKLEDKWKDLLLELPKILFLEEEK